VTSASKRYDLSKLMAAKLISFGFGFRERYFVISRLDQIEIPTEVIAGGGDDSFQGFVEMAP